MIFEVEFCKHLWKIKCSIPKRDKNWCGFAYRFEKVIKLSSAFSFSDNLIFHKIGASSHENAILSEGFRLQHFGRWITLLSKLYTEILQRKVLPCRFVNFESQRFVDIATLPSIELSGFCWQQLLSAWNLWLFEEL